MSAIVMYHNPKCSTSMHALETVKQLGVDAEIVQYLKTPPDRATLEKLVKIIDDPVEDLVRKDAAFERLGLNAGDYVGNAKAVVDVLVEHTELLQRPIIVKGKKAIIGRPKDRVAPFVKG
ncbi:MAG TPA: ArsC/Spx/MgsR family protein [Acidimicrobiales bacterium]|jgi:arsenate reductase|nr:ArsC/Spx/MgsR family protein [Acidimicrobiales bacterium]